MTVEIKDVEKSDTFSLESKDSVVENDIQLRDPPDGGLRAWSVLIGCFCGLFATQGYGYAWGVYLDHFNTHVYPGELTNLTWIGSLWFFFTNITGFCHPYLKKKMGYGWMIGLSCFLSCFSMMMASITTAVWQLYITQGVLNGIASSLIWFPCIESPQQWFSSKRGLAVGLVISGSGIGGIAFSKVINAAITSVGYRWSLRIVGFMQLGLMGISFLTVKPLNPLPKDTPIMDFRPFKNKQFLVLLCIHIISNFALYIPSGFVPSYATTLHIPSQISSNISAVMSAMMFAGKIINGFISDRLGRSNMTFFCSTMTGIVCLAVWLTAQSVAQMYAFAVLFGLFGGGHVAMITAVISECVGPELIESSSGFLFSGWMLGGLLGQPISAVIIEYNNGSYKGAITFAGVLFLFCGVMAGLLRFMRSGPTVVVKV